MCFCIFLYFNVIIENLKKYILYVENDIYPIVRSYYLRKILRDLFEHGAV